MSSPLGIHSFVIPKGFPAAMKDILDHFEEEPITGTQWFFVFGFGFVYAFYSIAKLSIIDIFLFEYVSERDVLYCISAIFFLMSHIFELCFCIVSLRVKYLGNSSKTAHFVCFLYSVMAFCPIIMMEKPYDDLPIFLMELLATICLVIVASTPFVIMANRFADYFSINYLK